MSDWRQTPSDWNINQISNFLKCSLSGLDGGIDDTVQKIVYINLFGEQKERLSSVVRDFDEERLWEFRWKATRKSLKNSRILQLPCALKVVFVNSINIIVLRVERCCSFLDLAFVSNRPLLVLVSCTTVICFAFTGDHTRNGYEHSKETGCLLVC